MKRIKKIGVFQTSKVIAVYSVIVNLLILIIDTLFYDLRFYFILEISNNFQVSLLLSNLFTLCILFIGLPILSFVFSALFCLFYNLASKWTGGIEIYFEESDDQEKVEENN